MVWQKIHQLVRPLAGLGWGPRLGRRDNSLALRGSYRSCGVTSLQEMRPYLQIQGKARVTTEKEERHGFWNDMLAPIFDGPDDPKYSVIVVDPYRIEYCTPGSYEP